ncbi:E-selectin-like [Anopheles moucheti]|uniref:E-selectin-like n=1 Tax=Anopheles moucheti TaxID=186751 RepID=UPI0022F00CAB|nr:E-selectin-like [Anopheles moucheti]
MTFKSLCLALCLALFVVEAHGYKEYVAYKGKVDFYQAWQLCNSYGGHLASIESAAEQARAEDAVRAVGNFAVEWFIGAIGANDQFAWIGINKKATYLNFAAGEPNNLPKGAENCIVIGAGGSTSKWNDIKCDYKQAAGYICAFVRQ